MRIAELVEEDAITKHDIKIPDHKDAEQQRKAFPESVTNKNACKQATALRNVSQ